MVIVICTLDHPVTEKREPRALAQALSMQREVVEQILGLVAYSYAVNSLEELLVAVTNQQARSRGLRGGSRRPVR